MHFDSRPHVRLASNRLSSTLAILGGVTKITTLVALGIQQKRTHNIRRTIPNIVGLVVRLGSIKANFAEHNITLSAFLCFIIWRTLNDKKNNKSIFFNPNNNFNPNFQ
jgi:hypothetical protein